MLLIATEAPRWRGVLDRYRSDFYSEPCYAALEASWAGGQGAAFYDEGGDVLVPVVLRPGSDPSRAVSPYGYPGVVGAAPAIREAVVRYLGEGAEEGIVTSFLRLHPLLNEGVADALSGVEGCRVVEHGPTVSTHVGSDDGEWVDSLPSSSLRRNIRKLLRLGYSARFDHPEATEVFLEGYRVTMDRLGAAPAYLYDRAYVDGLRACLGDRLGICVVTGPDGGPACAGVFTCTGQIAQYHLSGTLPGDHPSAPTQVMLLSAQGWAHERGADVLHLGGGLGGRRDALFEFKNRFAHRLTPFVTVRLVHDPERYESLCQSWLVRHGRTTFPDRDFFPLYDQSA